MDSARLLVEPSGGIDEHTLDEIYRGLLTFSDTVFIHCSSKVQRDLDPVSISHLSQSLHDLVDAGLVSYYGLESDSQNQANTPHVVISEHDHMELYSAIIGKINQNPLPYRDALPDPERTSRIIERRNELWRLGLATILDADLSRNVPRSISGDHDVENELQRLSIKSELTSQLFSSVGVHSLAHLEVSDVMAARKERRHVRKQLAGFANEVEAGHRGVQELVAAEFANYMNQLNEIAEETTGNGAIRGFVQKTTLNVLSLFIPTVAGLAVTSDLIDFFRNRKRLRFMLYLRGVARPRDGLESLW